jgi:DNA-binding transcriptional MerR regulator
MEDRTPRYRIGLLAERTGVSPERLRAWETRYRLLEPTRTYGNFRLYSLEDVRRVELMCRHLAKGIAAAQAAELARGGVVSSSALRAAPEVPRAVVTVARRRMRHAFRNFDETTMERALDGLFASFSVEAVLRDAVLPFLGEIGQAWEDGEATPGQEHFATTLIHTRLASMARGWGTGSGPLAILACPPGELHTLGALAFGICLARRGWRIAFMGADTPLASIAHATTRTGPSLVVLASVQRSVWRACADDVQRLGATWPLALAGHRAGEEVAAQAGARWLADGPVGAAATVVPLGPPTKTSGR